MNVLRQNYFKLLSLLIIILISLKLLSISIHPDNQHFHQQLVHDGNTDSMDSHRKLMQTFNEENTRLFLNVLSKLSVLLNKTNHVMNIKLEVQNEDNTQSYNVDRKLQKVNGQESAEIFTNGQKAVVIENWENDQDYGKGGKLGVQTKKGYTLLEGKKNSEVRALELQKRKDTNGYDKVKIDIPTYHLALNSSISSSFKAVLTPQDKQILMDTASYLVSVCEDLNITCMMYGGTLLGSWRHHDIVPWDDDIDVILSVNERDELYSALTMDNRQFHVISAGPRLKLFSIDGSRTSRYPWLWPYIDISFYYENATHIWDSSPEFKRYSYLKSAIFPPHLRPLGKLLMFAPRDTFSYLARTYKGKKCETYSYSHKREKVRKGKYISIPCEVLKDNVGFVHRSNNSGNGITEVLMLGTTVIHTMNIDEPKYAITDPYTLKLL